MIETERRAHELDIVELTEDLPEFGLRRGERGTVVEAFDHPEEAYVLEFVDKSGSAAKLAYGVTPDQIENIDSIAKEYYRKGMTALNSGEFTKALRDLRKAIELIPSYVRGLHNSLAQSIGPHEDWPRFIFAMKLVRLLDPDYEMARENLAIAYLNLGVHEAKNGTYDQSIVSFHAALAVEASSEVVALIKDNLAASFTALGKQAMCNDMEKALSFFAEAHFSASNRMTRLNLGKAHVHYANFCSDAGKLERAIASYQRAEDAGLMLPEVLNNHACALAGNRQFDESIMIFEAARALAPADETIEVNLSKLLALKQLESLEIPHDLVTEHTEIDFLTPPMNSAALHVVA